jgi:hypothetical protein
LSGYIFETKTIDQDIINSVIKERDFNSSPEAEIEEQKSEQLKTHCCPDCSHYMDCELKWTRGIKGAEQLCCHSCPKYLDCSMKKLEKV